MWDALLSRWNWLAFILCIQAKIHNPAEVSSHQTNDSSQPTLLNRGKTKNNATRANILAYFECFCFFFLFIFSISPCTLSVSPATRSISILSCALCFTWSCAQIAAFLISNPTYTTDVFTVLFVAFHQLVRSSIQFFLSVLISELSGTILIIFYIRGRPKRGLSFRSLVCCHHYQFVFTEKAYFWHLIIGFGTDKLTMKRSTDGDDERNRENGKSE